MSVRPRGPAASSLSARASWLEAIKWLVVGIGAVGLIAVFGCALLGGLAIFKLARQPTTQAVSMPEASEVVAVEASPTAGPVEPVVPVVEATAATILIDPVPGATAVPSMPDIQLTRYDYDGTFISYDPELAAAVEPTLIAAQTGSDLPPWELAPQHQPLDFLGYPQADTFHEPRIYILTVAACIAIDHGVDDSLATLQQMLLFRTTDTLPDLLPFLPTWNAGQMVAAQVKYLDFKNGSGVRYLTQYGQGVYPITNQALIYTFQGLTSDHKWWISAGCRL